MNEITFTLGAEDRWIPKEYYPVPSIKTVPNWYKDMETSYAKDKTNNFEVFKTQTIKRCMPVLDAITIGYMFKTFTDIYVHEDENKMIRYEWSQDRMDAISFHDESQVVNYKNENRGPGVPKLRSPWGIKTPKGYSCLFIPPMHQPASGITILEGVVDTDTYTNSVQFPFILDKGFTGLIPAGTPFAQIIPFKRDSFRMKIGETDQSLEDILVQKTIRSTFINGYRNKFRQQKDYL